MRISNEKIRRDGHGWVMSFNGSPLTSMNRSHMATRRQKESGSTSQDLEKNSGKGAKEERIKNMNRGSIICRGQDSVETESVQPNSPPGEWLNDDDCTIYMYILKFGEFKGP